MLAIKSNIMADNAARMLGISYDSLSKSIERLSSGLRINSAKDDAAGLAVRELMRADIAVIKQGSRNAQDGISMLQTMEGAMQAIDDALVRMKELAEQASTGSYSTQQRNIMNNEFVQMREEIDRIATRTEFNSITMLDSAS
ncbi:MAG: flagellin, partial [Planctomycetes bacterium]|nr:flagellin [Planctomycetota bacterium]